MTWLYKVEISNAEFVEESFEPWNLTTERKLMILTLTGSVS